ncbi:hypothetical protein HAX54_041703 [Datura stramonium]|uniref:Uncharacterized protein n=1 Tax=Datura stramonium TaxID=4076 RepID=A0ABS8VZQ4_DATST|nr:hypothetical protein [Datura stramonium]
MEAGCFPAIGNFVGKGKRKMRVGKEEMEVLEMEVAAEVRKKGWPRFAGVMESEWFFGWSSSDRETLRDGDREKGSVMAASISDGREGEENGYGVSVVRRRRQWLPENGAGLGDFRVISGENERERMERDMPEIMVRGEGTASFYGPSLARK